MEEMTDKGYAREAEVIHDEADMKWSVKSSRAVHFWR